MVALIALIPAICVLCVALFTQSKASTIVAAVIAALVGLAGGPAYTVLDLICVAVATTIAFSTILSKKLSYEEKAKKDQELKEFEKKLEAFHNGFVKIAAIGIAIFMIYSWNQMTQRAARKATQPTPTPAITPPATTQQSAPATPQLPPKTIPKPPAKQKPVVTPLHRCLSIKDESLMMDCLAKTP